VRIWGTPVESTLEEGLYAFFKLRELFKKTNSTVPPLLLGGPCGDPVVFPQETGDLEFKPHGETLVKGLLENDPVIIWHALLPLLRSTTDVQT